MPASATSAPSILFLGKKDDERCERAGAFLTHHCPSTVTLFGAWGEKLPQAARDWRGDYVISYLSRWVVPQSLLDAAAVAAINFHPATPHYPGIGCNNFALYEEATEYGVTCHHMAAKVDTGKIIAVDRFPVYPADTVRTVLSRTYDVQLGLFYRIADAILTGQPLPESDETWTRPPFSRKQFDALGVITPEMDADEVRRRVRATSYGPFQPYVEVQGHRFKYEPPADV